MALKTFGVSSRIGSQCRILVSEVYLFHNIDGIFPSHATH